MLVPGILKFHDVSVKKKKDQNTDIFSYLMWLFRSRYFKNSLMLIELTSASFHVAPLIQWKKSADLVGVQGPGSYRFNVL